MTSTRLWDRAGDLPVPVDGERPRPEVSALPAAALPSVEDLFTFMRDAELRFGALRMRIEERIAGVDGERLAVVEVTLRHPGDAKVITSEPELGTAGNYEVWISDGETVRTYSGPHKLGTQRPVRRRVVGLEDPDLPGFARLYRPLTALPMETLPETFVHPAGYCQNVLATGRCSVVATDEVAGREAIVLVCDHPRAIERVGDRPDFRIAIAVDRATGVIVRLVETVGDGVTRHAEVTALQPDAPLPPSAFEFAFPSDTTFIY
jgi:outer membrane lipoprotein-sorting protein